MLSVGRELKISHYSIYCQHCLWQGSGAQLLTRLLKITSASISVLVYCCPQCHSFDVVRLAEVLPFHPRSTKQTFIEEYKINE